MPKPISQTQLKRIITLCPDTPPRTQALEAEIKIGVGFHNKWYRSQREHWLGWIVFQEYKALDKQRDINSITARDRWKGLNCIPMMFWLAEVAGVDGNLLTTAEQVARIQANDIPCDCPQHGKAIRQVLKWEMVEDALQKMPESNGEEAYAAGKAAYAHLASIKSKHKRILERH